MNQTFKIFIAFHISMRALQLNISTLQTQQLGHHLRAPGWMDGDVALLLYLHLTRKQGKNPPSIGIISIFEILDEKESIRPEKMRVHCIAW